ncbi:phosphoribosylglycinamide formyltransferase [bacterium 1xD42-67]|nr:phosphoribosylglycinamide formyltransferase [bacterium 1xD42-67]
MKNIAVFVSGGGTNLQALIDAQARGELSGGKLALVLSSSPDAYALERARQAGIPTAVCSKKELGSQDAFESAIHKALAEHSIHVIVLAGFLSILSEDLTSWWPERILNIHPSLIPSFCGKGMYGLKVHEAVLARGVKVTGATVHFVTAEPDGGPIVLQKAIDILPDDTPESLQRRVMEECEWKLLPKAVDLLCRDALKVEGRTVKIIGGRVIV